MLKFWRFDSVKSIFCKHLTADSKHIPHGVVKLCSIPHYPVISVVLEWVLTSTYTSIRSKILILGYILKIFHKFNCFFFLLTRTIIYLLGTWNYAPPHIMWRFSFLRCGYWALYLNQDKSFNFGTFFISLIVFCE